VHEASELWDLESKAYESYPGTEDTDPGGFSQRHFSISAATTPSPHWPRRDSGKLRDGHRSVSSPWNSLSTEARSAGVKAAVYVRHVYEFASLEITDKNAVEIPATWSVPADHEIMRLKDPHLLPATS
jgi:hypothetical protein